MKKHAYHIFSSIVSLLPLRQQAIVYNALFRLVRFKVKVAFKDEFFTVSEGNRSLYLIHAGRLPMYRNGIMSRFDRLLSQYMVDQLVFSDGDVIVDCGANIGEFSIALSRQIGNLGVNLEFITIEPSPKEFTIIEANAGLFGVKVESHCCALGNTNNVTRDLFVKSDTADSSVIETVGYTERISVREATLGSIVGDRKIKLMKLEAEGFEPEILEGADSVISQIEYLTVDCGFERGVKSETTFPQVVNKLTAAGFSVVDVSLPRLIVLFKNENG